MENNKEILIFRVQGIEHYLAAIRYYLSGIQDDVPEIFCAFRTLEDAVEDFFIAEGLFIPGQDD